MTDDRERRVVTDLNTTYLSDEALADVERLGIELAEGCSLDRVRSRRGREWESDVAGGSSSLRSQAVELTTDEAYDLAGTRTSAAPRRPS
jgi:hypothetical protein